MLSACQSLPFIKGKVDASQLINQEFTLVGNQSVIGQIAEVTIETGDSLPLIARYFGLGFDEITLANPKVDPWIPDSGQTIKLPLQFILPTTEHQGLVLNLAAKRLFYFPTENVNTVITFPIGIGRDGWLTPTGTTTIVAKKAHPDWVVPDSIRLEHARKGDPLPKVVAAGPNNPLGDYAMRLAIPGYLIHGTNKPYGVGMAISHGCVRLYPENIANLFKLIPTGTKVKIVNQPFLIGWKNQDLYIQVYTATHLSKQQNRKLLTRFKTKLKRIENKSNRKIDWHRVEKAIRLNNALPVAVFGDTMERPLATRLNHPADLSRAIKPAALVNESWRIKVAEFTDESLARRLAVMLNHQGPAIPSHVLANDKGFMIVSGPFDTIKDAQASLARLRIDFSLSPELIEPGKKISDRQDYKSFLSELLFSWL